MTNIKKDQSCHCCCTTCGDIEGVDVSESERSELNAAETCRTAGKRNLAL